MTNSYHCYQSVGSMAVLTKRGDGGAAPVGTPVLVILTDHNDDDLYYGVTRVLHHNKRAYRSKTTVNHTVLPGHERVDYFYARIDNLDFCDGVTKENAND